MNSYANKVVCKIIGTYSYSTNLFALVVASDCFKMVGDFVSDGLNIDQANAVTGMVQGRSHLLPHILLGPPGTEHETVPCIAFNASVACIC